MRTSDSSAPTVRLTARQQEILELIERAIAHTGAPPTRAEIATELGFKSANAAEEHLQALARKGMIELRSGTSRGIRLTSRSGGQQLAPSLAWASELPSGGMALPLIGRVAAGAPHSGASATSRPCTMWIAACFRLPRTTCSRCVDSPCAMPVFKMAICWPCRRGKMRAPARLWWPGWTKRSPSSACATPPRGWELQAANPDFAPIIVRPGQPCAIEGIVVGLIRTHTSF